MKNKKNIFKKISDITAKIENSRSDKMNFFYTVLSISLFILFWEFIARIILRGPNYKQFSGFLPSNTFKALFILLGGSFFWSSVFASLTRIILGLFAASALGIPFGLLIGFYRIIRKLTNIPIQFLRMVSPLAWMPIAIVILPGFQEAIIFIIAISSVWPILINTSQGVANVDIEWLKMAKNQGARDYQLLFNLILPASIPYILTGFRLAVGVAWVVLVPAELLGISSGLGYLINDARDTMEYDGLMAIVIAIGLIGFLIDGLFQMIQKRLDWRIKK